MTTTLKVCAIGVLASKLKKQTKKEKKSPFSMPSSMPCPSNTHESCLKQNSFLFLQILWGNFNFTFEDFAKTVFISSWKYE
jgi:hypothetical protein